MQTLNITDTRKSPYKLEDIGFKDGDLLTIEALADGIAESDCPGSDLFISKSWIKKYAADCGSEVKEMINYMFEEYEKERRK